MKNMNPKLLDDLISKQVQNFYDQKSNTFFSQVSGINPRSGLNNFYILNNKDKIIHSFSYWKDIFPESIQINKKVKCSEIDYSVSKDLYLKEVLLKENSTKKVIKGIVVDTCFESGGSKNKGIIVQFNKKDVKGLIKKYKMGKTPYSSRNKDHVECDLSNLFYGKYFTALITT